MDVATEQMFSEIANIKNEVNNLETFVNNAGKVIDEIQMNALRNKI